MVSWLIVYCLKNHLETFHSEGDTSNMNDGLGPKSNVIIYAYDYALWNPIVTQGLIFVGFIRRREEGVRWAHSVIGVRTCEKCTEVRKKEIISKAIVWDIFVIVAVKWSCVEDMWHLE